MQNAGTKPEQQGLWKIGQGSRRGGGLVGEEREPGGWGGGRLCGS